MQERGREQAVPLAVGDADELRRRPRPAPGCRTAPPGRAARAGRGRPATFSPTSADRQPAGAGAHPAAERGPRLPHALLPGADVVGALEADRGRDHALRADRAVAPRAPDVGLPVRVPVAGRAVRPAAGGPRLGGWVRTRARSIGDRLDHDVVDRTVAAAGLGRGDRVDDVAGGLVGDLAEDRVLAVQVRRRPDGDEELRAVRAGPGVGHRQQVRAGRSSAPGGTRPRTGSRGRRCRCPAGRRPGS